MGKKNTTILIVFFLMFFGFLITSIVKDSIAMEMIPVPGTCGMGGSNDKDYVKCCKSPVMSPDDIHKMLDENTPKLLKPLVQDLDINKNINNMINNVHFLERSKTNSPCLSGVPSTPGDINNDKCICILEPTPAALSALLPACSRIGNQFGEKDRCDNCINDGGVWTTLGCFQGDFAGFINEKIFRTGVGLAGGISLLCIILAAFQMQTSRGNAEKIKKAQELLTNCITGLMVVIFSVLILKIIGVDILMLPGFNSP